MSHDISVNAQTGGALTLYNRPVSDWIYNYALASALKSPWVYDPSGALLSEPDVWEIVRNQTDMLAEITRHTSNVVRPFRVVPNHHASNNRADKNALDSSKRMAAICHEGLSHNVTLDEERGILAESFFLGRRYGVIEFEEVWTSLDGTPEMLWYLPVKIKDLDRRRVHWVPDWEWVKPDGTRELVPAGPSIVTAGGQIVHQTPHAEGGYYRKVGFHLEVFNTDSYRWERLSQEKRRSLIEYVSYDSEDRVGHGRGVLEAGFFTHWWLTNTFTKISQGIDRYANGVLIGRLDSLRNASTDKTNADMVSAMEGVMNTFRSEHYLILGEGDDVEIKDAPGKGMDFALKFAEHLINSWARLCNGSVRPAGHNVGGGTGSRAQSKTEEDTGESYYQPRRNALDHNLDRDYLGAFLYHNQENFINLGLHKAKRPKFTSEQVKRESPEVAVRVIGEALKAGMPLLPSEAYDKIEFTPPAPDDEKIEPGMGAADQLAREQFEADNQFRQNQQNGNGQAKPSQENGKMMAVYGDTAKFAGELTDIKRAWFSADEAMWWYNGWLKTLDPPSPPLSTEYGWDPVKRYETKDGRPVYWYVVGTGNERSLVVEGEETAASWGNQYRDWYAKNYGQNEAKSIGNRGGLPRAPVPQLSPSTPESEYWYNQLPNYPGNQ